MATILIVDDSSFTRKSLRRALVGEDYEILEAANGREGLEMIIAHKPDCVFLDMLMPELDGIEVLEKLNDRGIAASVIVITADIQEGTRRRCLELGAKAFINKPPAGDQLLHALQNILN